MNPCTYSTVMSTLHQPIQYPANDHNTHLPFPCYEPLYLQCCAVLITSANPAHLLRNLLCLQILS